MNAKSFALALVTLLCAPFAVEATVLDCAVKPDSGDMGWIGTRSIINWDEKAGTATVLDDIIYSFNKKKPMAATIKVVSPKQTAFSWTVTTVDSGGQYAKMIYRAAYFKADHSIVVSSKPAGYMQDYDARGTCTVK